MKTGLKTSIYNQVITKYETVKKLNDEKARKNWKKKSIMKYL